MKAYSTIWQTAIALSLSIYSAPGVAQCLQNHYVSDGAPSSQRDCQPFASFALLAPEQMTPAAQALLADRHAELANAARFYGFNLEGGGWNYTQSVSPLLQKHLLLSFTHADPATRASRFTAIVPMRKSEPVQVVPTFAHGLRLFDPGWQKRGTYSVFNRLIKSERGDAPIQENTDWTDYASLYLALLGMVPAVPTDSDSVLASFQLTQKRATTPVIIEKSDGAATIAFSDISDSRQTTSWKLIFNKHGQLQKVDMRTAHPEKAQPITVLKGPPEMAPAAHSPLNP